MSARTSLLRAPEPDQLGQPPSRKIVLPEDASRRHQRPAEASTGQVLDDVRILHEAEPIAIEPLDELDQKPERTVHRIAVPMREKALRQAQLLHLPCTHPR